MSKRGSRSVQPKEKVVVPDAYVKGFQDGYNLRGYSGESVFVESVGLLLGLVGELGLSGLNEKESVQLFGGKPSGNGSRALRTSTGHYRLTAQTRRNLGLDGSKTEKGSSGTRGGIRRFTPKRDISF